MSHDRFFTVVIPTFNRGDLILKTVNTVLAQTYAHFEIIIVDDCSTDNTADILEPLVKAEKIRYIKHASNRERSEARNTGMGKAKGEFLTFLDSDDLMHPTNLQDAATYLKASPQSKFFHNLRQLVDPDGAVLHRYEVPSLDNPSHAITGGNFLGCAGVFIHREIFERYRFDPKLNVGEDWDFWLRVIAVYTPGRINEFNSSVVHHGQRSTSRVDLKHLRNQYAYLAAKLANEPDLNLVYGKYLKRFESGSLLYISTVANLMREHGQALKCLIRAAYVDFRLVGSMSFMKALGIAILRWNKGH